jgi:drug/metabolite transporter (DMT)-like permease
MPLSVALGLGCAFFWGIADFMGGIQSRRLPALAVVLWSQLASTLVLMAVLLWRAEPVPVGVVGWGALAGGAGGVALMLFYRGLAVGVMSIVAPISAAGAIVPVIFAIVTGEVPTPLEGTGIAAAVAGVVLVSRPAQVARDVGARARRLSVALAVGAAIGFGSFYVIVDQATAGSTASPLLVMGGVRVGSLITLGTPGPDPAPGGPLAGQAPAGGDRAGDGGHHRDHPVRLRLDDWEHRRGRRALLSIPRRNHRPGQVPAPRAAVDRPGRRRRPGPGGGRADRRRLNGRRGEGGC